MSIDFDLFLDWAESRFHDVVVKGEEVKLNSIFCDDYKHHMWCNPSGGKNKAPYGVFHCWKTDSKGSLVNLVMQVDKCSFDDALEILETSNHTIADLENKVKNIFETKIEKTFIEIENTSLKLPEGTYKFDDLPSSNFYKKEAESYLKGRKINTDKLFVCTSGRYKNRILIPYYNKNKELIYYNGRSIGDSKLRYLGPPKELGIGKGDVLYVPEWPKDGEKIYLTEGEFDAISLNQCGLYSAAFGGKELSDAQIEIIKSYIPVLCLDADSAGADALPKMGDFLLQKGFKNIFYVRASKEHKDWNAMYQNDGLKVVRYYIHQHEKQYDFFLSTQLRGRRL